MEERERERERERGRRKEGGGREDIRGILHDRVQLGGGNGQN